MLLGANWLFQTVTFDEVAWLVSLWLVARLLRTGDRRLWLALGVAVGIGLETKYTIVGLIAGLAIGTLLRPLRRQLASPLPWLAAAGPAVAASQSVPLGRRARGPGNVRPFGTSAPARIGVALIS